MAADPSSPTPAESPGGGRSSGRGRMTLWGAAIVLLVVSVFGGHHDSDDTPRTSRAVAPKSHHRAGVSAPSKAETPPVANDLPRSEPTRLLIPKISVDAPFTTLEMDDSRTLQPPPAGDTNLVGWYAKGVSPGETGTAIIAGHLDTTTSAAVFANLDALAPGDEFTVQRADGRDADFVVDDAETFAKDGFPSERVFADAQRPEVRLITCAGPYDKAAKDYTNNLVVFAHLE
ncbi:class F sortase [Streptomyces sp. IMTB 2501]|uniref:class F sortase n=1 Tax=Streptomyces sp. IMTB 2501 TaxID=1776340 RepID=UPI00096F5B6E|nr:class F sortase [Streptomyces sp. IMTB 2501]OLZ61943.1 class F sortase [Streptomyces sp. IMTB 2501]